MEKAFTAYQSWLTLIECLSEAERGRLFTAALQYGTSGEETDLRGNERIVWATIRSDIDKDREPQGVAPKKKQTRVAESDFEKFYAVYPRKVAPQKAKSAFEAAMRRKDPPTIEQLIASVEAHKQTWDWRKDGGAFIPHPTTYLNQDRWRDDLSTAPKEPTYDGARGAKKRTFEQRELTEAQVAHILTDLDKDIE